MNDIIFLIVVLNILIVISLVVWWVKRKFELVYAALDNMSVRLANGSPATMVAKPHVKVSFVDSKNPAHQNPVVNYNHTRLN